MTEPLEATLRRLQQERDEADRTYNEALTALDGALRHPPALPGPPAGYDEHQITPLNEAWDILPAPPAAAGLTGRLTGFIWRTVAPFFQRQLTFNSRLVDHINRNVAAHRDAPRVTDAAVAVLREHLAAQSEVHSRLLYLLQQITPFVDTKHRDAGGGALVLNAALSALADSSARRAESASVRMQRIEHQLDARAGALERGQQDLQTSAAVAHQALATFKRELERHVSAPARAGLPATTGTSAVAGTADGSDAFGRSLDAYKYVGFEDRFRGPQEVIRERLESYVPFFAGATGVLDVGCGRGEFLDLLASHGIPAVGIDLNPGMVDVSRERGHDVTHADAVGYLASLEDGSLGGLFAAQVVEHLDPAYLLRFLDLAFHKLRPGSRMILETLNPACWVAFFESYIRDVTHVWPLHPETLQYFVLAGGFSAATIEYRSPIPARDRLQRVADTPRPPGFDDLIETFNANVDKLNARIFTHLDYAVVAEKGALPQT